MVSFRTTRNKNQQEPLVTKVANESGVTNEGCSPSFITAVYAAFEMGDIDIKLVADTLDALQTGRPGQKLRLCLDKGYDAGWLKTYLQSRRYEPHIQSRKEESDASKNTDFKAHRWVVERTHSWMNRFRRVLTRWEKKTENYEAMLHFACGLIVWNKVLLR
jgi:transposase